MAGPPPVGNSKPAVVREEGDGLVDTTRAPACGGDGGQNLSTNTPDLGKLPTGWQEGGFRTGFPVQTKQPEKFKTLIFTRTQNILQKPGETSEQLHVPPWPVSLPALVLTKVLTPAWWGWASFPRPPGRPLTKGVYWPWALAWC